MFCLKIFNNYLLDQILLCFYYIQEVYFKNTFSKGKRTSDFGGEIAGNRKKKSFIWEESIYTLKQYILSNKWESACGLNS